MKSKENYAYLIEHCFGYFAIGCVSAGSGEVGITWVRIKGGSFMMGGDGKYDGKPIQSSAREDFYDV